MAVFTAKEGPRLLRPSVGDFLANDVGGYAEAKLWQVIGDLEGWMLEDCSCPADKPAPIIRKRKLETSRWRIVTPAKDLG